MFYRCPQSYFLHRPGAPGAELPADGLAIDPDEGFLSRLHDHLTAPEGPAACRWCLGTVGRRRPHAQLPRPRWHRAQNASSEELLDPAMLDRLEADLMDSPRERSALGADEPAPAPWTRRRRRGAGEGSAPWT